MSISAMRAVPARDGVRFGFPLPSTPCRARHRPGSQLLRDFMRVYVERAEHDAWFRAEVEQSLKEADDPNVELIPHEEVVRKWKTRGAEWLKKAKRERGD